jgi:hypothetical protein
MKKYNKNINYIFLFVIVGLIGLFIIMIQYEGFSNRRQPIGSDSVNPECSNSSSTTVKNCNQFTSMGGKCPCINAVTNEGEKCTWVSKKNHYGYPVQGLAYGGKCQTLYTY